MVKHIYILLLAAGAITATAQNDNQFTNIGLGNMQNSINAPVSQAESNPTGNQQSFSQANFQQMALENKDVPPQLENNIGVPPQQAFNNNDNNVGVPVQQQSASQSKSSANDGISFSLPKPSAGFGSGASRSSGKNHSLGFSKKVKKFNRKLAYVFAKKHKKSYAVDFCFAWAK